MGFLVSSGVYVDAPGRETSPLPAADPLGRRTSPHTDAWLSAPLQLVSPNIPVELVSQRDKAPPPPTPGQGSAELPPLPNPDAFALYGAWSSTQSFQPWPGGRVPVTPIAVAFSNLVGQPSMDLPTQWTQPVEGRRHVPVEQRRGETEAYPLPSPDPFLLDACWAAQPLPPKPAVPAGTDGIAFNVPWNLGPEVVLMGWAQQTPTLRVQRPIPTPGKGEAPLPPERALVENPWLTWQEALNPPRPGVLGYSPQPVPTIRIDCVALPSWYGTSTIIVAVGGPFYCVALQINWYGIVAGQVEGL